MAFVDELDVLVDCEDVELDKFISAVAAKEIELLYNKLIIKIPIIKNIFDNFFHYNLIGNTVLLNG